MHSVVVGFLHRKSDKRVLNTVNLLSRFGQVDYLYWSEGNDEPITINGVNFIPFFHKLNSNPIKMWIDRRAYEKKVLGCMASLDADLFYIHHFATTKPLTAYRILSKKPALVITDFHEYVPEQYMEGVPIPQGMKTYYANYLYINMIKNTDGAVFVSKKMREMAISVKPSLKSAYVPNYALGAVSVKPRTSRRKEVVFVGKTSRKMTREIDLIRILIESGFSFTSLGSDSRFGNLKMKVMESLPYEQMMQYISESALTIISYDVFDKKGKPLVNMVYSMPNKFFDSISSGTPVVVASDFKEMAEIVEKNNTGIVINRNDVGESAERILSLWNSPQYENVLDSIQFTQNEYFWDREKQEQFCSFIQDSVDINNRKNL